jgi:hypothetical protein
MEKPADKNYLLMRGHGRCTGAALFAMLGCGWLLWSMALLHRLRPVPVVLVCMAGSLLGVASWRIRRSQPAPLLEGALAEHRKTDDRLFGWLNAAQWCAVAALFALLPRFGFENYVVPCFVSVVGLHFFFMPGQYRQPSHFWTGTALLLWAAACAFAFQPDGYRVAGFSALGAGVVLWTSAVWALLVANRHFRQAASISQ